MLLVLFIGFKYFIGRVFSQWRCYLFVIEFILLVRYIEEIPFGRF